MYFATALLVLSLTLSGRAAPPPLPVVAGTLQGQFVVTGAPTLTWTLTAGSRGEGRQWSRLEVVGEGIKLLGRVRIDTTTGAVSWRINEGRMSLGPWLPVLAARFASNLVGVTAEGDMTLAGSGTFENGRPAGSLTIEGHDLILRNTEQDWTLQGVGLTGRFAFSPDGDVKSTVPLELVIGTVTTTRFGARNLLVRGMLNSTKEFSVTAARVEIAGGEVEADPFTVPLAPLSVDAHVHIRRIGLQDFVALVPTVLTEARGRLSGQLRTTWNATDSLQLGTGELFLDEIEPTILRLAPQPGFLTSRVPARISLGDNWWGRLLSFANPTIGDLRRIELGLSELQVDSLRIRLTPETDEQGRSARMEIEGRPTNPKSSVSRVVFTVNVSGPLAAVMNFGLKHPFAF